MTEPVQTDATEVRRSILSPYASDSDYRAAIDSPGYRRIVEKIANRAARKGFLDPVGEFGTRLRILGEEHYRDMVLKGTVRYVKGEEDRHQVFVPDCFFDSFVRGEILPPDRLPFGVLRYRAITAGEREPSRTGRGTAEVHKVAQRYAEPLWALSAYEARKKIRPDAIDVVFRFVAGDELDYYSYARLGDVLRGVGSAPGELGRLMRNGRHGLLATSS